jgi:fimbrial isopeptide formation D2 family protein/uncharacterized repeat protein (TIGR01451 family)
MMDHKYALADEETFHVVVSHFCWSGIFMNCRVFASVFRFVMPLFLICMLLAGMFSSSTRVFAAGVPTATLTVPTETFIGEPLTFTAAFDNTGPDTGYGPYIDLYLPAAGADGAGAATDDGITFNSATYLGASLTPVVPPFPCTGSFIHPLTGKATTCTVDTQVVILQMPFGSFTPNQPAAPVIVNAMLSNLADAGTPLAIRSQAGFVYGNDPLDNPTIDPPIVGSMASASTTPVLFKLKKTYIGPEDETATGRNYPRDYQMSVDVANGQTITNLDITDNMPKELQFMQIVSATPASCNIATPLAVPPTTAPQNPPTNKLTVRCSSVTGGIGSMDAVVTLRFFVPRLDADGNAVLPPDTANDRISTNDAVAEGDWKPIDARDAQTHVVSDATKADHRLEDQAIAIQKSFFTSTNVGAAGNTPGDVLAYTLDFQVSDYFAFDQVVITDVLSDGLHIDPSFPPTLEINGNTYALTAASIAAGNYTIDTSQIGNDTNPATNGSTRLIFRVSDEIAGRQAGSLGRMVGGCVRPTGTGNPAPDCATYNDGPTTGKIVYHAIIQDEFTDTYLPQDKYVDHGDKLGNSAVINGRVLDTANVANPTGFEEADDTYAGLALAFGQLTKSIYAVNGSTTLPAPMRVKPGDTLTYRFRYSLPSSDFENLRFIDYLPLPVFDATQVTTFSPSGGIPPAGTVTYGPNDTYHALTGGPAPLTPAISTSGPAADNAITLTYGSYKDPQNRASDVDLLFTVTVSNKPFADGLFLTNQVRAYEATTNAGDQALDSIVQIKLAEPVLGVKKGVVATNNPAGAFSPTTIGPVAFTTPGSACPRFSGTVHSPGLTTKPIDSNLSKVDAGDLVTFAIVVENTGSSSAFDVRVRDTLPAGFSIPGGGLNLCVTNGAGTPMGYTSLGSGLFDAAGGIELNDPGSGALDAGKDAAGALVSSGRNIAIVTYDLVVAPTVTAQQQLTNTATLSNYASTEGGPTFLSSGLTDNATVTIAPPAMNKQLAGTEINNANNSGTQVVIGEIATYTVTLKLPEGITPGVKIVDTLDPGLAFVDMISATPSSGVSISGSTTPNVTNSGGTLTFDLGTVTNANTDNATPDTITFVYRAVVLNVGTNTSGKTLKNSAKATWTGGNQTVSAPVVTVVEPKVNIAKSVSPATGDAGDPVAYTITLTNTTGPDALDVTLNDPLPISVSGPAIASVTDSAGLLTAANFQLVGNVLSSVAPFDMPTNAARKITIVVNGTLPTSVQSGQLIDNTATVQWTSLPGSPGQRSTYNASSTERTGAGGVNSYTASSKATLTVLTSAPEKSIVGTSEPHTGCTGNPPCIERVALGEIVRYRLSIRVAEGTTPNVRLSDQIDSNMRFLNDGTARIAFISNDGGMTSTSINSGMAGCANLNVSGNSRNVMPTCPIPATSITGGTSGGTFIDSDDPTFNIGTIMNNDSDADEEYIVIELNVLVTNVTGNSLSGAGPYGQTRTNTFTVSINGTSTDTSNTVKVTTTEPVISSLDKQVVPATPLDAGDMVTYTLTYTNTGKGVYNVAGFDFVMTDTLDANLVPQSVTGTTSSGACGLTPSTFTGNISGQTVTSMVSCLNPGGKVTTTIVAKVVASVPSGLSVPNSANLTWSSLPGNGTPAGSPGNTTGSTTPGASGAPTGERNGADGFGSTLNKYASPSNVVNTTIAAPQIAKQMPNPTKYTIGDTITYYINVTLPEGVTRALVVNDTLPSGLAYISGSVITSAAASAGNMTQDYSGTLAVPTVTAPGSSGGGMLTLDFGDVTTTDDNNVNNNRFVVKVVARVLNASTPLNQKGGTVTNSAALTYKAGTNTSTTPVDGGSVNATIIEPQITTTKSVNQTSNVQAGNVLTYTARFANTGNSPAYDVTATDTLAQGTAYNAGSASCMYKNGSAVLTPIAVAVTTGSGTISFDGSPTGSWDIPVTSPASYIECTYSVTAQNSMYINGAHTNTIDANWSSQNGSAADERVYNDTPGYSVDGTQDEAKATFTVNAPAFSKSDGGMTSATIGQPITYTLTMSSPLGTVRDLRITDTLPLGLIMDASMTPAVTGVASAPTFTTSGSDIIWTFGDAVVTGSPVRITFRAIVANIAGNQDSGPTTLNNTAQLTYKDATNAAHALNGSDSVTVIEPALTMTKTVSQPSANLGDLVTYTLTVSHPAGDAETAYDTVISDIIPAGLAYEAGSAKISSGPAGTVVYTAPNTLNWLVPAIAPNETAVLTFQARVTDPALASATNTANVTWTSMPGASSNERTGSGGVNDYSADASATLLTTSYQISKTLLEPASGVAGMNDTVRFSIVVTNTGATALATVPLTDTYNTTFLAYQSATPASNDNTDDGVINWTNLANAASGGPIAPGATRTVTVTFKAKAPTLPGGDTINQAAASGVQDASGTMLPSHKSTAAVAIGQPDMQISKSDGLDSIMPGDTLTYTLAVTNSGTYTATNVVITETLPLYTSFVGPAGWIDQGSRVYTYAVGDLAAGANTTVPFIVHVNGALPASVTQVANTARVNDNGAHGEPTPANNTASDTDTIEAVPDLRLSKNDYLDFSFPDAVGIYTLGYQNTGNQDATGVVITETVPLYTTFDAGSSTAGWSCADRAPAGTTCTIALGTVAAGDSGSVKFAVKIAASLPAGIERVYNTAIIADDNGNGDDPTPNNNTASDDTPIRATPDMQISKSDGGITAVEGGTITYTLTYTNAGDQDATSVVITETLPLNTSFVGPTGWVDQGSGVFTRNVGDMAAGASGNITFMVKLDAPLSAGVTQVTNTVTIADDGSNGDDPTPDDNQSSVTTPVSAYQISKTLLDPASGLAGVNDTVRFSIVVTNTGDTVLLTVPLTDTYDPTVLQFVSATMAPDSATAGTLNWNDLTGAGSLAPGQTITVDVTFTALTPTAKGATVNHADVAGAADEGGTVLPQSSATADVMIGQPDLQISKTDGQTSVSTSTTLTYMITVTNTGTYTATGVVITDPLPGYTSFDGGSVDWENLKEDGNFTYALDAPLGPGQSTTMTFVVIVDATVPAGVTRITNTASTADDGAHGADPTPGNNTATDVDALLAAPDLALSKTHTGDFLVGHEGSYLLQVNNHGTTGTTGPITITDALPSGLSYVSASGTDWTCAANGQDVTCTNPGPLKAGDSLPDLTLTVNVGSAAWPAATNSAVVSTAGEGDQTDNSASDPTTIFAPDLQLDKRVTSGSMTSGAAVIYTLTYTNTGNQDATGVIITEQVPDHTSFNAAASDTAWSCAGVSAGSTCTLNVGAVAQGATGYATFSVIVDSPLPSAVTTIVNTAVIADDHVHGDDPTDAGDPIDNNRALANLSAAPTAVTLVSFTASSQNDGVVVQWQTGAEINTMGFDLYRSADSSRAHAERITPNTIMANGRGQQGASYSWTDTTAQLGVDYHYWLVETDTDNATHEYGPITVGRQLAAQTRIFLPIMGR